MGRLATFLTHAVTWARGLLPRGRRTRALPAATERYSLRPQDTVSPWDAQRPQYRDYTTDQTIANAIVDSSWAYIAITRNAQTAASVPWHLSRRDARGALTRVDRHPLVDLIRRPNELDDWMTLVTRALIHLQQWGNALWAITRSDAGAPIELWPLNPAHVKPVPAGEGSEGGIITAYRYTRPKDGAYFDIDPADVVHIQRPDPSNVYWGLSPMRAGGKAIDTDIAASDAQKSGADNHFMPPAIVSPAADEKTPGLQRGIARDKAKADKTAFEEAYIGKGKAGKVMWLGRAYRVDFLSRTPQEMSFVESRRYTREEILSLFGMPPPLAGVLENANYSNSKEMRRTWWEDTLCGLLEHLRRGLQMHFVAREYPREDFVLEYDTSGVPALQAAYSEKLEQAAQLQALGVPLDVINDRLRLGLQINGGTPS